MEQNSEFARQLLQEGVSLFVLLIILVGIYRITNRMLDVVTVHLERCCEALETISDNLSGDRKISSGGD